MLYFFLRFMKKYSVREKIPETADVALKNFPPLIRSLLYYRDITDEQKAHAYINPDYERDLHDPFLMLDMEKAVERIKKAVQNNENIIVYGDYDCDGIPGSVVLHDFFEKIEYKNFKNYIPHRYREGYGLQMAAIEQFGKDGITLVITIDCAITDVAEVARANELGIDVIVTDHHLPIIDPNTGVERLPPAFAVINNKRFGEKYPFIMLCGAATAFKLVQGLLLRPLVEWNIAPGWEKWLLDMVGTSTIADMVPLNGENRALAHFGLKVLRKSPRPGLRALLRKMKVAQYALTEDDIGFSIAPRINAASRIADPIDGFHLLSTHDEERAVTLSTHLETINLRRKGLVAAMVKEARGKLAEREIRDVVVIGNTEWFPGLVGLAANTIMEEFERPVFVWGRNGTEVIKGSCRSTGNVNVVELMTQAADAFIDYGGHAVSGGFSVENEKIHFLEDALIGALKRVEKIDVGSREEVIDAILRLDDVSWSMYGYIEQLAPFGMGNPKPLFLLQNIQIDKVRVFGKEKNHLGITFIGGAGQKIDSIAFFAKPEDYSASVRDGGMVSLAAHMEKSVFAGKTELRLRIVDIF